MDSPEEIDRFIGRRRELEALQAAYRSGRSEFIPIYGRRRVGKSALILEFLSGKTSIYHVGKRAPESLQIHEFLQGAAAALQEPLLVSVPASDWKTALTAVVDRWKRREKLVIVLDEFQWTVEYSDGLPSFLQELWDRQWKSRRNVFLILCGSYIGFMEREVLGKKSPLFGRRTGQMLLKPFGYREAAELKTRFSITRTAGRPRSAGESSHAPTLPRVARGVRESAGTVWRNCTAKMPRYNLTSHDSSSYSSASSQRFPVQRVTGRE